MIRHIFYILLISFTLLSAILAYRLGVFKPVKLEIKKQTQFQVIFKEHIGPYHKIVPIIEGVEKWAKANGLPCTRSFGAFLDDPKTTEEVRLRSHGGCLINSLPLNLPEGFKSAHIQLSQYVYAEFTGSPGIGVWKVYSPVFELMKKRRFQKLSPIYEVYEITGKDSMKTRYYFPFK